MNRYRSLDKSIEARENGRWYKKNGPNGRPLCRQCGEEVSGRRRSFCSDSCYFNWEIKTDSGFARRVVFERDQGVCAHCGLDTHDLAHRKPTKPRFNYYNPDDYSSRYREYLRTYEEWRAEVVLAGLEAPEVTDHWTRPRSFWEADHIVAVVDGGGECGIENYQTLCIPCHRKKTTELCKRRAQQKRLQSAA